MSNIEKINLLLAELKALTKDKMVPKKINSPMTKYELKEYVVNEMANGVLVHQCCGPEDMVAIAYNKGLEDAATVADIKWGYGGGLTGDPYVDRESILKLKI